MDDFVKAAQPYLTLFASVASVAVLGLLVHLLNATRNAMADQVTAARDQANSIKEQVAAVREQTNAVREQMNIVREQKGVADERAKAATEELARTQQQLKEARDRLARILGNADVSLDSIVSSGPQPKVDHEVQAALSQVVNEIQQLRARIETVGSSAEIVADPDSLLNLAEASFAAGEWLESAAHFDEYLSERPLDWEAWFAEAVAYANSYAGGGADRKAVRGVSVAIALAPRDLDANMRARLYAYRGAFLKRLGRLEEAEHDLLLARRWATASYEVQDIAYNLAAVYAMQSRRDECLAEVRKLGPTEKWRAIINSKPHYFKNVLADPEFKRLMNAGA